MLRIFHAGKTVNRHLGRRSGIFLLAGLATLVVACGSADTEAPPEPIGNGPSNSAPVAAAPTQSVLPTPTVTPAAVSKETQATAPVAAAEETPEVASQETTSIVPSPTSSDSPVATPSSAGPSPTETAAVTTVDGDEGKMVQATPVPTVTPRPEWNIEDEAERTRANRFTSVWRVSRRSCPETASSRLTTRLSFP